MTSSWLCKPKFFLVHISYQRLVKINAYTIENSLVLLDVFIALLSIIKMNEHVGQVVLEFHCLFCLQLVYFFLLHPCLICNVKLLFLLHPSCHLIAVDRVSSRLTVCWNCEIVFIIIIDIFFEVIFLLFVIVAFIILNVFIVGVTVRWLLWGRIMLCLLIWLLVFIADPEIRSNYLHFSIFIINRFLRIHILHQLRLLMN